jgi:hypothetical protein
MSLLTLVHVEREVWRRRSNIVYLSAAVQTHYHKFVKRRPIEIQVTPMVTLSNVQTIIQMFFIHPDAPLKQNIYFIAAKI